MTPERTGGEGGVGVRSDHNLVIVKIKLKLCRVAKSMGTREKFDVNKLRNLEVREEFLLELRNRFSCLAEGEPENGKALNNEEEDNIEGCWRKVKVAYNETAKKVLGYRKRKSKVWVSVSSSKEIEERRKLKKKVNYAKSERLRNRWTKEYLEKDKMVKRCLRKDKRVWANNIACLRS